MATLYNTYRPRTFDTVIGQQHVVRTLRNAIDRNLVGHAYLLTGPRGTGKTTLARIFAHAVNCTPREGFVPADAAACAALADGSSLDIIELDAASYTGVDNIRELRETVALPPTAARFKVYIIDEAHMLSTAAWNAFLKTLEEPPAHAIFVFATTEVHKVPATILSRVQRFDLGRLTTAQIADKLAAIAAAEGIAADREALTMIAAAAAGGMRDAESMLAQVRAAVSGIVTAEDVRLLLGVATRETELDLASAIADRRTDDALATVDRVVGDGIAIPLFIASVLGILRHALVAAAAPAMAQRVLEDYADSETPHMQTLATTGTDRLIVIIEELTVARTAAGNHPLPRLPLEIAIIRLCGPDTTPENSDNMPPSGGGTAAAPTVTPTARDDTAIPATDDTAALSAVIAAWPRVLATVRKQSPGLATVLAGAIPHSICDGELTILVGTSLFVDKINAPAAQLTLTEAVATLCNVRVRVRAHRDAADTSPSLIAGALAMMGGGRIVETA